MIPILSRLQRKKAAVALSPLAWSAAFCEFLVAQAEAEQRARRTIVLSERELNGMLSFRSSFRVASPLRKTRAASTSTDCLDGS